MVVSRPMPIVQLPRESERSGEQKLADGAVTSTGGAAEAVVMAGVDATGGNPRQSIEAAAQVGRCRSDREHFVPRDTLDVGVLRMHGLDDARGGPQQAFERTLRSTTGRCVGVAVRRGIKVEHQPHRTSDGYLPFTDDQTAVPGGLAPVDRTQ